MAREAPGYQGRGPPRRVVSSQNGNAAGYARRFSRFLLYAGTSPLRKPYCMLEYLYLVGFLQTVELKKMLSLNAWRAATTQCAPSPQACPRTSAPGRAAGDPRRVFVSIQACIHRFNCRRRRRRHNGRLKHVVARPSRSSANDANPPKVHRGNGFVATCADNSGTIYSAPLYICRVVLLLLRQRPSSTEKGRRRCRPREQLLGNCNEHPQAANNGE